MFLGNPELLIPTSSRAVRPGYLTSEDRLVVLLGPLEVTVSTLPSSGQNEDTWPRRVTGVPSMRLYSGAERFPECGTFASSGGMQAGEWGEGLTLSGRSHLVSAFWEGEFGSGVTGEGSCEPFVRCCPLFLSGRTSREEPLTPLAWIAQAVPTVPAPARRSVTSLWRSLIEISCCFELSQHFTRKTRSPAAWWPTPAVLGSRPQARRPWGSCLGFWC